MDTMNRREEGFERAYSHDEEIRFRARARRNRLIGVWAGDKLHLTGDALKEYAADLVSFALDADGDETLVVELGKSLTPLGVSEHRIRRRLDECAAEAMRAVQAGR